MSELLRGEEWTVRRWVRAPLHLDDEIDLSPGRVPLTEELRIVAALAVLACVALLLV